MPLHYKKISHNEHSVLAEYSQKSQSDMAGFLLKNLEDSLQKDSLIGYTSTGPHRDDIIFYYNNKLANESASRGEIRSVVLALKFIEVDIIEDMLNKKPIILLDDVFSELDNSRQNYLMDFFEEHQVVITATESNSDSVNLYSK